MSKNLVSKLEGMLSTGELFKIVDESNASAQVLYRLGFSNKGQYVKIVKEFLLSNDVCIKHFTPNGTKAAEKIEKVCPVCKNKFLVYKNRLKINTVCSKSCSNTYFRSDKDHGNFIDGSSTYREKALKHYKQVCSSCGYDNVLALEVHHIDKNRANNDIGNLKVLCANCHRIEHHKPIKDS